MRIFFIFALLICSLIKSAFAINEYNLIATISSSDGRYADVTSTFKDFAGKEETKTWIAELPLVISYNYEKQIEDLLPKYKASNDKTNFYNQVFLNSPSIFILVGDHNVEYPMHNLKIEFKYNGKTVCSDESNVEFNAVSCAYRMPLEESLLKTGD